MVLSDTDVFRSASHSNMAAHLTAPLQAGAMDSELSFTAGNRIVISGSVREPLLLVAPKEPLNKTGIRLNAVLDPDGAPAKLQTLRFEAYTEPGAYLLLHRPAIDPVTRSSGPFTLQLALEFFDEDGAAVAVADSTPATHLNVRLVQGTLGTLIYLLGAEKQRIRRQAREIVAMRSLTHARRDALNKFGADLAVPRFYNRIQYDTAKKEIVTVHEEAPGKLVREPDPDYRRRLRLYLPFLMPTPGNVLRLLNGPGSPADPNAGAIGELGSKPRFSLVQQNNELAFAVHLSATSPDLLKNLLDYLGKVYLVWPANVPAANSIHSSRPLPSLARQRMADLRRDLRKTFDFGSAMAIAPQLAWQLGRVARCCQALGFGAKIAVQRAQDANGGSRYQLGLGVDIQPLTAAQLDALHAARTAQNRLPADSQEIETLIRSMQSKPAAADPQGEWLFAGCGLRTIHRVSGNTLYLSHLPTFGLVVQRTQPQDPRGAGPFEARYHAPGDPGANVVLTEAIAGTSAIWAARGAEAFTVLTDAAAQAAWSQPVVPGAGAQIVFKAAGLPGLASNAEAVQALKNLPAELIETLQLGPVLSQQIIAGAPAAIPTLRALVDLLRAAGIVSVLPLVVAGNLVHLVLGVIGLPEAGINLSDRRATGFRWYVAPVQGPGGNIKTIGARTLYAPLGEGINAIVCVGYARRGLADPYEFRVELPEGANLNLVQYEYLMNLLERVYPLGVEVNTFSIRRQHVDLDGDGQAEALPPSVSKTYRRFQRQRHRGEQSVGLDPVPEGV